MLRTWSAVVCAAATVGLLLHIVSGRLAPYAPDWPHQLTAATLMAYVNKTFGSSSRCLKVAVDGTAEAADVVTMLHHHKSATGGVTTVVQTIELDGSAHGSSVFCPAYVVVGHRQAVVDKYLETFRNHAAERMLVIVFQTRKYIKPFIKVIAERRVQHVIPGSHKNNIYKHLQSMNNSCDSDSNLIN